jgi:hypothetical protein
VRPNSIAADALQIVVEFLLYVMERIVAIYATKRFMRGPVICRSIPSVSFMRMPDRKNHT